MAFEESVGDPSILDKLMLATKDSPETTDTDSNANVDAKVKESPQSTNDSNTTSTNKTNY